MDELTARTVAVAWRKAGEKLGFAGPGLFVGLQLDGCIGSFGVRVDQSDNRTRIVIHDERPSTLSGFHWRAGAEQSVRVRDGVATGDASFDDRVVARGDPVVIAAFFTASMRRSILRATTGGGSFEGGILSLDLPEPPRSATALVSAIRRALALARRMTTPRDLAASLATNARRDTVPAVRLNCLEQLCESFPKSSTRIVRAALRDPDPGVRLRAATVLPEEGRRQLLGLARGFRLDETIQAGAIAALNRPPVRAMRLVLGKAIKLGEEQVALEAISALGRSGSRKALVPLARHTKSPSVAIRVAAIRALSATRQTEAQVALVSSLGSTLSEAREAAAEGLGNLGTVNAVAPLRAAVDAHPLDLGLRRAVSRAIASIQARATGAEPGQLSLAVDAGTGALSLTDSESGQLSLTPDSASPQAIRSALPRTRMHPPRSGSR